MPFNSLFLSVVAGYCDNGFIKRTPAKLTANCYTLVTVRQTLCIAKAITMLMAIYSQIENGFYAGRNRLVIGTAFCRHAANGAVPKSA